MHRHGFSVIRNVLSRIGHGLRWCSGDLMQRYRFSVCTD